jgi:hypothetical protein
VSGRCRYHCRECSSHFTSLEGFDAHHEGSGETLVPCAWPDPPEGSRYEELFGVCKISAAEPARGVIVHRLVREGKYGAAGRESAEGRPTEADTGQVAA